MGTETGMPANHRLAERQLIEMVRRGSWEIDKEGRIWIVRAGTRQRRAEKILASGYLMVRATLNGKRVVGLAHRLVWQHFNGDIDIGKVINHRNGKKGDNRPSNLETSTYSENTRHARRVLGASPQHGQHNPQSKLTPSDIAEIRLARSQGEAPVSIAARFGVRYQHVYRVCNGERWGHLAPPSTKKGAA